MAKRPRAFVKTIVEPRLIVHVVELISGVARQTAPVVVVEQAVVAGVDGEGTRAIDQRGAAVAGLHYGVSVAEGRGA